MIKIKNLTKSFGKRKILDNVNLSFPSKGLIVLYGDSGSGKTTLLNCIAGLINDFDGSIFVNNCSISALNNQELREFRLNNFGFVHQNFKLLNLATAYQNVKLPLDAISLQKESIKKRRIDDIFSQLGITNIRNKTVNKLSGGEKQRVAIARALVNSPNILLCDEPTGALDEENSNLIYRLLLTISKKRLVVIASHDHQVRNFADQIIKIEDGLIKSIDVISKSELSNTKTIFGESFSRKKSLLPFSFKFKYALSKVKAKKIRSLITYSILSLSLTGIGVSLLISFGVSDKISAAFSSITNGNQIVMSLNNKNPNTYNSVYSAPESKVMSIYEKYSSYFDDYGVSYLVNYENFFKDNNNFYISSRGKKYYVDSLSTRSINDYKWLDSNDDALYYPYKIDSLENDEIVLGLSYVDMVNICYELQIQRNYGSLGNYIRENDLTLTLEVANNEWGYDDEQLFTIRGIRESNKTCFYHYKHLWNFNVFEEMMRLPGDDDQESYFPWEMFKIYYFKTIEDPSVFLNASLKDSELYDFTFERTNYSYHPLLCKIGEVCQEKRVMVYYADKNGINTGIVDKISSMNKNLKNYFYISDYGYASYATNMLSGFSKNIFASLDKNSLDTAVDMDTMVQDNNTNYELPVGVVNGNYINSLSGGLKFSTKIDNLISGRKPKNVKEIVISSGLAKKLGYNDEKNELYFSGISNETILSDGKTEKEYSYTKVVIVGINEESNDYIYNDGIWTISFFRDLLGISMFYLTPKAIIFELENNVDTSSLMNRLNQEFRSYKFESPTIELTKSIDSTLDYANIILISFSVIAIVISIILLGTVITLNVMESKDDIQMFECIGISKKDINSLFITQSLLFGFFAFLISSIQIVVIDFIISISLSDLFMTSFIISFNFLPILIVFICSIVISFLTSFLVTQQISKKKHQKYS